jgi:mono/diheme cytochrome c family protein
VAKDRDRDDDNDENETEDDDDDDKKCTATPPPAPTPAPVPTATGALGKIAWTANCASCHTGDLGKGRSASKTLSAIASNKGGVMGALSGKVTAADAANIAEYTKNPSLYP